MGGTASRPDDYGGDPRNAGDHDSRPATPPGLALDDPNDSNVNTITPTDFKWSFGGHSIYVTGAWDDWRNKAALSQTTAIDFTTVLALPLGTYQYKFIVDGNWKHSPAYPTERDQHGNLNNIVTVTPQTLEYDSNEPLVPTNLPGSPIESYDYSTLPQEDHTAEPPTLPRLLASAPLDKHTGVRGTDFVRINHIFDMHSESSQSSIDIRTMASEMRYKSKIITTILVTTRGKVRSHVGIPGLVHSGSTRQPVRTSDSAFSVGHSLNESQALLLDALNNV